MKYIFFIAAFNAFFFIVLLFQKKSKVLQDRILIFWLFYLGVSTLIYALTTGIFSTNPILSSGIIALLLLHGPFLYLYVSALTSDQKYFQVKNSWHFLPFMSFIIYLVIASGFQSYSKGISLGHHSSGAIGAPVLFQFFLIMTVLSGPVYFFLAFRRFRKTQIRIRNFSSMDIDLNWLGKLIAIFGIVWTSLIIVAVIHHIFHLFSMEFCTDGLFLSLSVFIILIGYFGLKQKNIIVGYKEEVEISGAQSRLQHTVSKLEGDEIKKCFHKINSYMEAEEPYLDPDLTMPKLAESLQVPHHHLSQVINEIYGENFFNFINKYRVEEVKDKIKNPEFSNYSLLGIAMESGFNSKSAFNRVFKKFTGTTPSKFQESLKSK